MDELKEKIIFFRAKHRLTQKEFAKICGVTPQTISNIENGYQDAMRVTQLKIEIAMETYNDETEHHETESV